MSAVVAGTKLKLQNLMPGMIGTNRTFSDSYVEDLIMAGFYEVIEKCDLLTVSQTISLGADTLTYDLSSKFIEVTSVEFLSDGTNVDGHLNAATHDDLDMMSCNWRDDRGTRPEHYVLLSAPGLMESESGVAADCAKIQIYRPMSAVTSEAVKVKGLGLGDSNTTVPEDVQRLCLVPYVMAHLKAVSDPQMAGGHMDRFLHGCDRVRGRFADRYTENV